MSVKYVSEEALAKSIELTKTALNGKVDKDGDKGLSTNDLTDDLVSKINASDTTLGEYERELGTVAEIKEKLQKAEAVDPDTIDKNIKDTITAELAKITGLEWVIPDDNQLPSTGEAGKIYLIPIADSGREDNLYEEYVWLGSDYELIGTTEQSLDGFITEDDLVEMTATDVVTLWNK